MHRSGRARVLGMMILGVAVAALMIWSLSGGPAVLAARLESVRCEPCACLGAGLVAFAALCVSRQS